MTPDVEKTMKPEATIKDIIKFFNFKKQATDSEMKNTLSFMLFQHSQTDFNEVYSSRFDLEFSIINI